VSVSPSAKLWCIFVGDCREHASRVPLQPAIPCRSDVSGKLVRSTGTPPSLAVSRFRLCHFRSAAVVIGRATLPSNWSRRLPGRRRFVVLTGGAPGVRAETFGRCGVAAAGRGGRWRRRG